MIIQRKPGVSSSSVNASSTRFAGLFCTSIDIKTASLSNKTTNVLFNVSLLTIFILAFPAFMKDGEDRQIDSLATLLQSSTTSK